VTRCQPQQSATLSIIIPTLNEASILAATLDAIARLGAAVEVIVVDGGSEDETAAIACAHGVHVYTAPRGRGGQLHAGAGVAQGAILWFLHADTHPPVDAVQEILRTCADPTVIGGNFAVQFDGESFAARFLTWLYPHLSWLGLCYGDSGIFVRRDAYEQIGGFGPLPLFEDLDFVRRLKKQGRFIHLRSPVVTSSRRFEGRSFTLTFARWMALQLLYWLGVKPGLLARLYAPTRKRC
jgi:rSAM/selenodomain-associated transferase 2